MKKTFQFDYNYQEAGATFVVDTDVFKPQHAKDLLEFFTWNYDKNADPIDELMRKWAMQAIEIATAENYNEYGVKSWFKENEGFLAIDGSMGVELKFIQQYEFDESVLFVTVLPEE